MEFNEKLQELRRQKGMTQQELADALYVSRTAISKWESGRGYPSIESLKAIAAHFSMTLDELLSTHELLNAAEEACKQQTGRLRETVFGLMDVGTAQLLFLPLFATRTGGAVQAASLLTLHGIRPYLMVLYVALVAATVLWGILTLALQSCTAALWHKIRFKVSLSLSLALVLLLTVSLQPYAAVFTFMQLVIKALLVLRRS